VNALEVHGLGKAFRKYRSESRRILSWFGLNPGAVEEIWALQDISFKIAVGEAVAIVGQNGAGKSTLLKLITGTQSPTRGTILANGRVAAILELGMGFNPEFTGRQNSAHGLGLMGFGSQEISAVMSEVERFADIGNYFDQPVRTYSSGMQMRVAFATATAFRPEILIIDEALSVGDGFFQAKCFKRISEFVTSGTTLLLVTHSMTDVLKHCGRAIYIESGRMVMDGSPRDVTNRYLDALAQRHTGSVKSGSIPNVPEAEKDRFASRPFYRVEEYRWKASGAKIIDFEISCGGLRYPAVIKGNSQVEIRFKVLFERDYDSVVPGILVKTIEGIYVYGANSILANEPGSVIKAHSGETKCFRFMLEFRLAEGPYLISLGISSGTDPETLLPLDRRYDSILVNVSRSHSLTGLADLEADFSTEDGFLFDD